MNMLSNAHDKRLIVAFANVSLPVLDTQRQLNRAMAIIALPKTTAIGKMENVRAAIGNNTDVVSATMTDFARNEACFVKSALCASTLV